MRTYALVLALAAVPFAVPAAAASTVVSQVAVQYKDLDLTTEAGQKTLDSRLDRAAREVCGMNESVTGSRVPAKNTRDCYRQSRTQMAKQLAALIDRPLLGG